LVSLSDPVQQLCLPTGNAAHPEIGEYHILVKQGKVDKSQVSNRYKPYIVTCNFILLGNKNS
jgi:hypothetical protein